MKLMETQIELSKLQENCSKLQKEVLVWKEQSNQLAKSCKLASEVIKETIIKPTKKSQQAPSMRSVSIQTEKSNNQQKHPKVTKHGENVPNQPKIHPAPLPDMIRRTSDEEAASTLPPKLKLVVSSSDEGIQLFWTLRDDVKIHTLIKAYEIYAYLESAKPPSVNTWKKVGDVKAIPLPIKCTLSQFKKGSKYHFSVRARDVDLQLGDFSEIQSVLL